MSSKIRFGLSPGALAVFAAAGLAWMADVPAAPGGGAVLHGGGATFPAPLYQRWIDDFAKHNPAARISYEKLGSGEGVRRFLAEELDFAASDAALSDEQIAQAKRGARLVPATAGLVVLAYNLKGLAAPLQLPRAVYEDIFARSPAGTTPASRPPTPPPSCPPKASPSSPARTAAARPGLSPII